MATRALVGFIQTEAAGNVELTSTYNHYDGYPESLGVALDKFYSIPEEALKISNMGYISYLNSETGEIEAKHKEPADKTDLGEDFEEGMMKIAEMGDSYGADYIYIYNIETSDWVHASIGRGIRGAAEQLRRLLIDLDGSIFAPSGGDDLGVPGDNALGLEEGDYITEWKSFLNEGTYDAAEKIKDLMIKLKDEPKDNVELYLDSVKRDIKRGDVAQYKEMSIEDMVEDYENYIQDKMDS